MELVRAMGLLHSKFPTCISQVTYKQSPVVGKFYFVGCIPQGCFNPETRRTFYYETEQAAIDAAIAAGAERIQRVDCSFVSVDPFATAEPCWKGRA